MDGTAVVRFNKNAPFVTVLDGLTVSGGALTFSDSTNHWEANGSGTLTISNVLPSAAGTATISKWLQVSDGSDTLYIPAWT